MKIFVTIELVSDDFPFRDIADPKTDREARAYRYMELLGAKMGMGDGKPLFIRHTIEVLDQPDPIKAAAVIEEMKSWLLRNIAEAKRVSASWYPYSEKTIASEPITR